MTRITPFLCALALALSSTAAHAATAPACYPAPDLPGLGDNMFSMHFDIVWRTYGNTTPDQGKEMMRMFRNFSNGTPFTAWSAGMTRISGGYVSFPYLLEETAAPWGDGTPGSGRETYRDVARHARAMGGTMGFFLDPCLASPICYDLVPDWAKTLDASGNWTFGWPDFHTLSLRNMLDHIDPNGRPYLLNMIDTLVKQWGPDEIQSVHFDYLFHAYAHSDVNLNTRLGGAITTREGEYAAADTLGVYLWNEYGISSSSECDATSGSCMIMSGACTNSNGTPDHLYNRVNGLGYTQWGAQGPNHESLEYVEWDRTGNPRTDIADRFDLRKGFYKYFLFYQYCQKTRLRTQVQDGVTLYKRNGPGLEEVTGDRFVPQAGAGCRIIAYSEKGGTDTWTLPQSWTGIASADVYSLTMEAAPLLIKTGVAADGSITLAMAPDQGYLVVPQGYEPTPIRITFDDLKAGDTLSLLQGVVWNNAGNPPVRVQARGPGGIRGGMGTYSVYLDDAANTSSTSLTPPAGAILHSLRIGNKGGSGTVTLSSSAAGNAEASFALPDAGRTALIETNWLNPETGNITFTVTCAGGAQNVLTDDWVYGLTGHIAVPHAIRGRITWDGAGLSGVRVRGNSDFIAVSDSGGYFSLDSVFDGTYAIRPEGFFSAQSREVIVSGGDATGQDFEAVAPDSIRFPGHAKTMMENEDFTLAAVGYSNGTSRILDSTLSMVSWLSLDTARVTVAMGRVLPKTAGGPVPIIARCGNVSDTLILTVVRRPAFIRRINFQCGPVPFMSGDVEYEWPFGKKEGWATAGDAAYQAARGWGWLSGASRYCRDNRYGNFLMKSIVGAASGPADFRLDVPEGEYQVRVGIGDNAWGVQEQYWTLCRGDTICLKPAGQANAIAMRRVTVPADSGLILNVTGPLCYLVVMSTEAATDFDAAAMDGAILADSQTTAANAGPAPLRFALSAFPNPFNPSCRLMLELPRDARTLCRVYSLNGRLCRTLVSGVLTRGRHAVAWDGTDGRGARAAAGIYIIKLSTGKRNLTKRVVLSK